MPKKIDPDATKSDKLLKLYRLLLGSERKYSTLELTKLLNCSKQSIRHLVDTLNSNEEINVEEETDPKTRTKRYFIEHCRHGMYEPIAIEGYRQMELCRDIVGELLPEDDRKKLELAIFNAANYLPRKERFSFKTISFAQGLSKGHIDYSKVQTQLHSLYECINRKKCCLVSHQKFFDGELKKHCFAPMKLIVLHENFYIAGFIVNESGPVIPKYDNPTNFAVQRITEVEILEDRSSEKLPALPEKSDNLFGIIKEGQPFTVKLKFTNLYVSTYVADRLWSDNQKISFDEDGSLILNFNSDSYYEVLSFVMAYGSSVTVLEPEFLRQAVKDEIARLSKIYK